MLNLVPTYGRVYSTEEEVLADWNKGLDFKVYGGPYTSIRDIEGLVEEYVTVRVLVLGTDIVAVVG